MREPSDIRDYQFTAIELMVQKGRVAVLMKPGLGKTPCAQTALLRLGVRRTLVVAPSQVVETGVWSEEARLWRHLCHLRINEVHGPTHKRDLKLMLGGDIDVISYGNLLWLTDEIKADFYDAIIYDELSKMKHPGTKRFKRMKAWAKNIKYRFGLTGSPMGNHWLDLWGEMFITVGPAALGPTKEQYVDTYFKQIPGTYRYDLRKDGSDELIRQRIKPHAFSISAKLAAQQLPEVIANPIKLQLPAECIALERKLREEFEVELASGRTLTALNQSKLATSVRQLASGAVYTGDPGDTSVWDETHRLKLDALRELVDEAQGEPMLVFIWFQHERQRILRDFPEAKWFDGSATMAAAWNAKRIPMMLLHPMGSGLGLNLQHGGSQVTWFTLPWSRELYDQGNARVARIGQRERFVTANALLAGRIDREVWNALARKGDDEASLLEAVAIGDKK